MLALVCDFAGFRYFVFGFVYYAIFTVRDFCLLVVFVWFVALWFLCLACLLVFFIYVILAYAFASLWWFLLFCLLVSCSFVLGLLVVWLFAVCCLFCVFTGLFGAVFGLFCVCWLVF